MPINPEALLMSAIVRTGEHQKLAAAGVIPEMFHRFEDEAEWLFRYLTVHRKAPTSLDLKQQFPEFVVYKGADNVEHYITEVIKSHKKHVIIEASKSAMDLVDQDEADQALELMQRAIVDVNAAASGIGESVDIMSNWQSIYDDVRRRRTQAMSNGGVSGIPTGFDTLDAVTGGLQPGWLTIIAARLGQGKTFAGIKLGFTAAVAGKRVLFFSLEQPRNQIALRVHAFGSRKYAANPFNPMDLARGQNFDIMQYKKFLKSMEENHGTGEFRINDASRGRVTPNTIAGAIQNEQPDIVIIDYLTLLSTGAASDDWRGAARLSGDIQALAHSYKVPIVALAQINRSGASGKEPPGVETLYSSDAIGHDADLVVTQTRRSDSVMMHKIGKFRHGPDGGKWYSEFRPAEGVFDEVSGDDAAALMEQDKLDEVD